MYHTYIIQSTTTGKTYIVQTNNLQDRISRHNSSRNIFTKNKGPWVLIFSKKFDTRKEALELEKKLKGFKNKNYLLKWIKYQ